MSKKQPFLHGSAFVFAPVCSRHGCALRHHRNEATSRRRPDEIVPGAVASRDEASA
jgi:hypothetical protein